MKYAIAFFATAALAAGVWDFLHGTQAPHAAKIIDTSSSVIRNCDAVVADGKSIAREKLRAGSKLSLLSIGRSAAEPAAALLFDKEPPAPPEVILGQDEQAFAKAQAAYFTEVRNACLSAPASRYSPVLRLVKDAIAHLRSKGCAPGGECFVEGQTDLEDDVDEKLAPVIRRLVSHPDAALPKELIGSIDNRGIRVSFCLATRAPRSMTSRAPAPEAIERVWTALFSRPDLVSFKRFCGM